MLSPKYWWIGRHFFPPSTGGEWLDSAGFSSPGARRNTAKYCQHAFPVLLAGFRTRFPPSDPV